MLNKQIPDFDLAVIGGGLAGLTLAIQMADKGYKIGLFEKEMYPFHKVCGEYISMESWNFLISVGIPLPDWNLPVIQKLVITDTKGKPYNFSLPLGGFGVSRFQLDDALYQLALHKGVVIYTGTKVSHVQFENDLFLLEAGENQFIAKTVAGAFGKRSNLDIKWKRGFVAQKPNKINHMIGVKYHIKYSHPEDTIALHNFHNGYCGMSRIENDRSCLCYLTTAENLQKSGNSIRDMEKDILFKNKQLADIFTNATFLFDQPLSISQISFQQKTQVENHVLMIGDAAGLITPLCGNGMSMSMNAAKIAATLLHKFLSGNMSRVEMEQSYVREWQQQFSLRTNIGRVVQRFFGASITTSLFLQTMNRFPGLSKFLIKQTHGVSF
jgi:flavin-dependent dehydrogenase